MTTFDAAKALELAHEWQYKLKPESPQPLIDMLRAAVAEVERWERIAKVQDEKAHHWLERMRPLEAVCDHLQESLRLAQLTLAAARSVLSEEAMAETGACFVMYAEYLERDAAYLKHVRSRG